MGRVCGAAASCCPFILLVPRTVCGSSRAWTLGRGGCSQASRCFSTHIVHKAPGTTFCCGWCWGLNLWRCWGHLELRSLISVWISLCLLCLRLPPLLPAWPRGSVSCISQQTCTRKGRSLKYSVDRLSGQPHH